MGIEYFVPKKTQEEIDEQRKRDDELRKLADKAIEGIDPYTLESLRAQKAAGTLPLPSESEGE